jgi:hypothetical protein
VAWPTNKQGPQQDKFIKKRDQKAGQLLTMIGYRPGGQGAAAARSCMAMFTWAQALPSERSYSNSNILKLANSNHGWVEHLKQALSPH